MHLTVVRTPKLEIHYQFSHCTRSVKQCIHKFLRENLPHISVGGNERENRKASIKGKTKNSIKWRQIGGKYLIQEQAHKIRSFKYLLFWMFSINPPPFTPRKSEEILFFTNKYVFPHDATSFPCYLISFLSKNLRENFMSNKIGCLTPSNIGSWPISIKGWNVLHDNCWWFFCVKFKWFGGKKRTAAQNNLMFWKFVVQNILYLFMKTSKNFH